LRKKKNIHVSRRTRYPRAISWEEQYPSVVVVRFTLIRVVHPGTRGCLNTASKVSRKVPGWVFVYLLGRTAAGAHMCEEKFSALRVDEISHGLQLCSLEATKANLFKLQCPSTRPSTQEERWIEVDDGRPTHIYADMKPYQAFKRRPRPKTT
jgi:hypothetical protein